MLQKSEPQQPQLENAVVSPNMLPEHCVEEKKLDLEGEIEHLKRDKCALAAEVVRLRQLQESSKRKTQAMIKRVQIAEKRQEQMTTFLAKAVQSPVFLAQLVKHSERLHLNRNGRKRKHLSSRTEQPEVLVGVEEPQILIETDKYQTNAKEEMQGIFFSIENAGGVNDLLISSRNGLSSGDDIAMLMGKPGDGQSTMSSATSPQARLVTGAKTDGLLDSTITMRLDGTLEDAFDDSELNFDLLNFIEEIAPTVENNPHGGTDMLDAFWVDLISKLEVSGALTGGNMAPAINTHTVDRETSGEVP